MPDRFFKYWILVPAVFLLLLIGLFPLIYSLLVSFQQITMTDYDTSFVGFVNYAALFEDLRLWQSILHTLIITAIALPVELLLGLAMAQLFLEKNSRTPDFHLTNRVTNGYFAHRCWSNLAAFV